MIDLSTGEMMNKPMVSMMIVMAAAALSACPAAPTATATTTTTKPAMPTTAVAPAPVAAAPAAIDPALLAAAKAYKDEPKMTALTPRLRQRAEAKAKACAADEDGCEDAFYLSCGAGEAITFAFDRLQESTAFYTAGGRPYATVMFLQDAGAWKIDAMACGTDKPEMPWAH